MEKTLIVDAIDRTIMTREEFRNFLVNAVEGSDITDTADGADTLKECFQNFLECHYSVLDLLLFDTTDRSKVYDYFIDRVLQDHYNKFFPIEIEV